MRSSARPGKSSLSVILPAFNEEANIVHTLRHAREVLQGLEIDHEIIVVDDGSTDQTVALVRQTIGEDPTVRLVEHPVNRGYGAALKSGLREAKRDLFFFTDSDGQFDIGELPLLFEGIDRFPIVIGYRRHRRDPLSRRLMARGWGLLIRFLFKLNVRDIDCAFKLFRREVFDEISVDSIGAFVNSEILVRARKKGFSIREVPVTHFPRDFGVPSGAKPRIILHAFRELTKLYRDLR